MYLNLKNDLTRDDLVVNGVANKPWGNPVGELQLLVEGLPNPVTNETMEQMGPAKMKHLAEHLKKKAERKAIERAERESVRGNPEKARELQRAKLAVAKVAATKSAAKEQVDKKAAAAAEAAKKGGKKK